MKHRLFEVTIPVLNEERELEQNVRTIYEYINGQFSDKNWAIVIADNGSSDRTQEIALSMEAQHEWLRYVRLEERGVGRALKASWGSSEADIVGYMDLDIATDLSHFSEAIRAICDDGFELVYGTRLHKRSKVIGRSLKREFTSRVFNFILRTYLRTHFSDGMCGFKFLKRSVLDQLCAAGAVSDGWFFSTELLATAEWLEKRVYELPVTWTDSSDSKVKIPSLAGQYLRAMRVLKKKRKGARNGR